MISFGETLMHYDAFGDATYPCVFILVLILLVLSELHQVLLCLVLDALEQLSPTNVIITAGGITSSGGPPTLSC